ncbi:MAG: hypothetical protein ACI4PZ_01245 [Akkermansia sp.]
MPTLKRSSEAILCEHNAFFHHFAASYFVKNKLPKTCLMISLDARTPHRYDKAIARTGQNPIQTNV